jgi:D-tyrosyl-tRNA(Tyr) deacylase
MKVVVQKVKKANVKVNGKILNEIDQGYMLLVGFTDGDNLDILPKMAKKIANLRIFEDENGVMNKSILDVKGSILSISQFTLYANTKDGNRPSYLNAMKRELALPLYNRFNELLNEYVPTKNGSYGNTMLISLENDGPTTIIIEM